jgi:mRNA interferase MazF
MNVKQRDLVLIPVPFSDQTARKVRPAIVISNDRINNSSEDVLLVPVTSVLKDVPYSMPIVQESLSEGKLLVISRARADKIFTAEKSLIQMKIGALKPDVFSALKQEILKTI